MGIFITFEGTEGSGKSTQIKRLGERIQALGKEVILLREPGGTPLAEEIRHLLKHSDTGRGMFPEAELLLMNAARAQLVREIIKPALAAGKVVLCDRYFDSTIVYQGFGRNLDINEVQRIVEFAIADTIPDLTFLLRVPLAISEQRRATRNDAKKDRFEEADRVFFEAVEAGYDNLAVAESDRVRLIDATKSIEEVGNAIWLFVKPLLEQRIVQGEVACKSVGEESSE